MKRFLSLIILFTSLTLICQAAKKPEWVDKRPVDKMSYIGIGVANKANADYMQIAKKQALNDLASEIKVEIQSESLLQTIEKNDQFSSNLSHSIQVNTQENLEQFELTDSWENDKEYWVYYHLDKVDYQNYMAIRKAKITSEGYAFWMKGIDAQQQGDLITAIDMYIKGLTAIQPYANEELKCQHKGATIDVGIELYGSLKQIFTNISITPSPASLQMKSLKQVSEVVVIDVKQNETPLKNMKLKIAFKSGGGQISSNEVTDINGKVDLNIQNITSKNLHQEIGLTIDMSSFSAIKSPFMENVLNSFRNNLPQATISINVEKDEHKAYIRNQGRTNEILTKSIKSLLTNNYFTVVNDATQANILILIKCDFKKGNIVKGEMYDFNEYFTSVEIQVLNANDSQSLIDYSISNHRSLSPISTTQTAAEKSALRDVMKRIDKEFKKELENININN
ncbi:LPP20 family lipoprotein [Dysgonomonas sp. ZJ709]|uniref:LPP20 family lipoprotein n=1 Tax=Dysgonomonas sp. ZJ709 TaxID=2709797 RepID=UPI0013EA0D91|nr:LPP20 family lipoprotein [Dysgonomonas sp. ZJ709]